MVRKFYFLNQKKELEEENEDKKKVKEKELKCIICELNFTHKKLLKDTYLKFIMYNQEKITKIH